MPAANTRRENKETVRIEQPGSKGLDLDTRDGLLAPSAMRRLEHFRIDSGALVRRPGSVRIAQATNNTGSMTFGATTKYATIPASTSSGATPTLIPAGGWALRASFVATRPSGGNTAWLLSSRPAAQTYHVLKVTLSDAGVVTVGWRDNGSTDRSVATSAITNGATVHLLALFDPVAGTFTVYVDGTSSGTPLTGLSSSIYPINTASVVWAVGVEKETSAAVTANTQFAGAIDALTLFSLRGTRPSSGTPTLTDTLRRHSFREWPNPQADAVLFHYGMNETSGAVMYDRSRHKNHGTYVGTPTPSAAVALSRPVGNYIGTFNAASGKRTNLYAAGGSLYYETVRSGA